MEDVTKHYPTEVHAEPRDYLPAAGRHGLLPFYDVFTKLLGIAPIHRALIRQAELAPGQRVLEIGCGTGNLSVRAKRAQPGVDFVGSDPDPEALARARRKIRGRDGIRFERGYAQRLPYPDASFDRVLSAFMLHHLDQDAKVEAARQVARVLRPGGSLHVVDLTGHMHGAHGFMAKRAVKTGHVADNVDGGIPRLLDAAGLVCTEVAVQRHRVMGQVAFYRAARPE